MDDSLTRMGRDHVDLFQLHNPLVAKDAGDKLAIDIALNEVAPALEKLQKAGKTRFIGFSGVGETAALHRGDRFEALRHRPGRLQRAQSQRRRRRCPRVRRARTTAGCSRRRKAADMGTIIIRALAGGALSGTEQRHPLAMQAVDPIGSAPNFAGDVARAKELEPLVRESGSPT